MAASPHMFPYRFIDDRPFPRPYIPVTLRSRKRSMQPLLALVDSGADFCVLDLDLTSLETIKLNGVAGMATGYVAHIEIDVAEHFLPVPAVLSFDFSPKGFGGIIGQLGFFDIYVITFDRAHKKVVLK